MCSARPVRPLFAPTNNAATAFNSPKPPPLVADRPTSAANVRVGIAGPENTVVSDVDAGARAPPPSVYMDGEFGWLLWGGSQHVAMIRARELLEKFEPFETEVIERVFKRLRKEKAAGRYDCWDKLSALAVDD